MLVSPEHQCLLNVQSWFKAKNFTTKLDISTVAMDRCWLPRSRHLEDWLEMKVEIGQLERRLANNHGPHIVIGYRETVSRYAIQIVVHRDMIEVDFDFWQPWDLVGLVGHGLEVLRNKITRKRTDPFKIAAGLKKRGIYAI